MLYENEELRLKTININAEVESSKFFSLFSLFLRLKCYYFSSCGHFFLNLEEIDPTLNLNLPREVIIWTVFNFIIFHMKQREQKKHPYLFLATGCINKHDDKPHLFRESFGRGLLRSFNAISYKVARGLLRICVENDRISPN